MNYQEIYIKQQALKRKVKDIITSDLPKRIGKFLLAFSIIGFITFYLEADIDLIFDVAVVVVGGIGYLAFRGERSTNKNSEGKLSITNQSPNSLSIL